MPISLAMHPKRTTLKPRRSTPRRPPAEPVPCPACGHDAGFILDEDGFSYRVLEDDQDTDLLWDHDADTLLSCAHCDTPVTITQALTIAEHAHDHRTPLVDAPRTTTPRTAASQTERARTHKAPRGHPHEAGTARVRTTRDGTRLPACPQCPRDHGFFADLGGVAYHVLEDDQDTDLLDEADNLLCPDCGAVFTR